MDNKWITFEEAFPEEKEDVLLYFFDGFMTVGHFEDYFYTGTPNKEYKGKSGRDLMKSHDFPSQAVSWFYMKGVSFNGAFPFPEYEEEYYHYLPTAWMPLPKPYMEVENG